jgi:hypothetical protein
MFDFCQGFGENVCPIIETGVSIPYVILKAMSFLGNVFGPNFGIFTMSENDI